jgi:hypothetical protein
MPSTPLTLDLGCIFLEGLLKNLILIAALAPVLSACATITRGTTNDIQISSEPSGANVRTSISHSCISPCTIKVGRRDEFQVVFNKDGYKEAVIPVKTQVAGAGVAGMAGNVLVGGVVGVGVDAYTGAAFEHSPNPVHAVLEPLRAEPKAAAKRGGKKAKVDVKAKPKTQVEELPTEPVVLEPPVDPAG